MELSRIMPFGLIGYDLVPKVPAAKQTRRAKRRARVNRRLYGYYAIKDEAFFAEIEAAHHNIPEFWRKMNPEPLPYA